MWAALQLLQLLPGPSRTVVEGLILPGGLSLANHKSMLVKTAAEYMKVTWHAHGLPMKTIVASVTQGTLVDLSWVGRPPGIFLQLHNSITNVPVTWYLFFCRCAASSQEECCVQVQHCLLKLRPFRFHLLYQALHQPLHILDIWGQNLQHQGGSTSQKSHLSIVCQLCVRCDGCVTV